MDKKKGQVGLGIIARDHTGKCLIAHSLTYVMNPELVVAKPYAALNAILMGRDLGIYGILFEGDALQVVKAVRSNQVCLSSFGHSIWSAFDEDA